jgi:hypothetical protein
MLVLVERVVFPLDFKKHSLAHCALPNKATVYVPTTNDGVVAFIVQQ